MCMMPSMHHIFVMQHKYFSLLYQMKNIPVLMNLAVKVISMINAQTQTLQVTETQTKTSQEV